MKTHTLPPELLHIIIQGTVGGFLFDILAGDLLYEGPTEDEPLDDNGVTIFANLELNPVMNLLGTSGQIRHITLQVLSDALGVSFDATGIGRCVYGRL